MGARMIAVNPMIYRIYSRFQAFSLGGPSGPSFFLNLWYFPFGTVLFVKFIFKEVTIYVLDISVSVAVRAY